MKNNRRMGIKSSPWRIQNGESGPGEHFAILDSPFFIRNYPPLPAERARVVPGSSFSRLP